MPHIAIVTRAMLLNDDYGVLGLFRATEIAKFSRIEKDGTRSAGRASVRTNGNIFRNRRVAPAECVILFIAPLLRAYGPENGDVNSRGLHYR